MRLFVFCIFLAICCSLGFDGGNRLIVVRDGIKQTIGSRCEYEDIDRLNNRRVSAGLRPLIVRPHLMEFARKWSIRMACDRSMRHSGGPHAENVAYHSNGSAAILDRMWHNSSGHRHNRMNPNWKYVGVGVVRARNGALYATEVFGR